MNLEKLTTCLHCINAKCQAHCPILTNIPQVIQLYQNGEIQQAQELLFVNNPLSAICSIVCDHRNQCYGHCVRGLKGESVPFYQLEQELSYDYLMHHTFTKKADLTQKVAVVGGGPAGLTVAFELAQEGYKVTMFDDNPKIGGVLRYGIPSFRLAKDLIDRFETILLGLGVDFRMNCLVGPTIHVNQLLEDFDMVFLATGAGYPNKLNIPGESLGNVHYAIDYLKSPETFHLGKRVIVLGAGNVAMDAARTAVCLGHDTSIYYRKSFHEMKANMDEIEDTKKDGVDFALFQSPVQITNEGVVFCDSENVMDERGRIVTKIITGTEHLVPCDAVIVAVSQVAKTPIYEHCDITRNRWGTMEVDACGHTSLERVYAAGDGVSGAMTVVHAVAGAKKAAQAMIKELQKEENE